MQGLHQAILGVAVAAHPQLAGGQAPGQLRHVPGLAAQRAHHAAADSPGGHGHAGDGQGDQQQDLPHQRAHRGKGLLLIHFRDQCPALVIQSQRHEGLERGLAVQARLGQTSLLSLQGPADGGARQALRLAVVARHLEVGEAYRVRTQAAVGADQVGLAGFAQALAGLHHPVQLGQRQLQDQQQLQLAFVEDGRDEKLAGLGPGPAHREVADLRPAAVQAGAHHAAERGITPGGLAQVLLVVAAALQAEQHLTVLAHQLQFAVTEGLGEIFEDRPVIVGGADQGRAVEPGVAGAEVAGQGAELVVAGLPTVLQLLLFDICNGFQGIQGLFLEGLAGLAIDRDRHGQHRY